MALIPLSEWIDRFGLLDEPVEHSALSGDQIDYAWESLAATRVASARERLGALLKEAWERQRVTRLTLRRS